jgi:hypothetical protein
MHPESFLDFNSLCSFHLRVIFAMDPFSILDRVAGLGPDHTNILVGAISTILSSLLKVRQHKPGSIIVLSFRILQAHRIEGLQRELLELAARADSRMASDEAANNDEQLNAQIDARLHVYGIEAFSQ